MMLDNTELLPPLVKRDATTKIIFLVMDGLGGLPIEPGGPTELEAARTPNMDALACESVCGLMDPVAPGITPGSGPGHLGLFGYDPLKYQIGRGVLEALGIDYPLKPSDVAIRINFCTVDDEGNVIDRRAGRIDTDFNKELVALLNQKVKIENVEFEVATVKEHRAVVVFRGEGLYGDVADTDPQATGVPPKDAVALNEESKRMADIANEFIRQAKEVLKDKKPANMLLLRGFARYEPLPSMEELYGIKCAAIATYPMYRGLARIVGMDIIPCGETIEDEFNTLERIYKDYDYFFIHIKKTDSYGEDGNFQAKVKIIEEVDEYIPRIRALKPDVIAITGDHSTPALLKSHSWHPVPVLLWSKTCRSDSTTEFSERACCTGGIGRIYAMQLLPLLLAHAERLIKYGA